ncbi:hypothetical protein CUMW_261480 [Citrus unshiu]|uniref:Uncharacterized protein n=1 Tax=Citrus unshiu TaxID=55188 RepID=A0A2H5QU33_CITUN|nr:hypothetical protein CUMW_261480 [Citrus unshiu]
MAFVANLLLYRNRISMITDGFFQFMPSLKILNLEFNILLTKLPSGLSRELPEEMKVLINLSHSECWVAEIIVEKKKVELYLTMLNLLRRDCSVWKN